jgi:hypothetical protein
MSPMSPRTLRPRQTLHPEAANWAARVVANGGSVGTSLPAVDRFCRAIDAAKIRDRFFRVNLFCGGKSGTAVGLNSCLVPLYRGPSLGGTQYGTATDTHNVFDPADYSETGASGGLKGNGLTKYLDTGLAQSTVAPDGFMHMSVYARHGTYSATSLSYRTIGVISTSPTNEFYFLDVRRVSSVTGAWATVGGATVFQSSPATLTGGQLMTVTRATASSATIYLDATQAASDNVTRTINSVNNNIFVFAENRVGTGALTHADMTLAAYSIGLPLTAQEVSSFQSAMATFQAALSRNSGV